LGDVDALRYLDGSARTPDLLCATVDLAKFEQAVI
jgi:hypothetical protein